MRARSPSRSSAISFRDVLRAVVLENESVASRAAVGHQRVSRLLDTRERLKEYLREYRRATSADPTDAPPHEHASLPCLWLADQTPWLAAAPEVAHAEFGWALYAVPGYSPSDLLDLAWLSFAPCTASAVLRTLRRVTARISAILRVLDRPKHVHAFIDSQRSWHLLHGAHPPRPSGFHLSSTVLPGVASA